MIKYHQMLSIITKDGLELKLVERDIAEPKPHEIVVQVEATPINPSDHGVMFGLADMSKATHSGDGSDRVLKAPIAPGALAAMKGRLGQDLPVGNEGAGVVVAAGSDDYSQSLMGKRVAVMGGGMYGHYRTVPAMNACLLYTSPSPRDKRQSRMPSSA